MAVVAANHFKNLLNLTKQYSASVKAVKELRPVLNDIGNDKKAIKMWKRGVSLPGLLLVCAYVYVWVFVCRAHLASTSRNLDLQGQDPWGRSVAASEVESH